MELIRKFSDLDFNCLMEVYSESNRDNTRLVYPHLAPEEALIQVHEDFYSYLRDDFFRVRGSVYCLHRANGMVVSAARMEPYRDGWLLNGLETHPHHRCRGYAEALIRAIQSQWAGKGPIYSHVLKRNSPSRRLHLRCGFVAKSEHAIYLDGTVTTRAQTFVWESRDHQ